MGPIVEEGRVELAELGVPVTVGSRIVNSGVREPSDSILGEILGFNTE